MTPFAPFLFFFHLLNDSCTTYNIQIMLTGRRIEVKSYILALECDIMSSRGDLFFCAIFILSSIMLMATTSSLSINFKVYAADNCDATSTCTNVDNGISNVLN
ncbi:MAG: hypothetical protein WB612_12955, partial [Nitrososphaeraceae archaeon]